MPLCFCCLSTAEKVNLVMSNFGALHRLSEIEKSDYPQFLCGRILPIDKKSLRGPISGKECVYYEAVVERLEDKNDDNGLIGIPDPEDSLKVWIPLYFEKKSADFILIDPTYPSESLYVPGASTRVNVLATEDTSIKTGTMLNHAGQKAKVILQQSQLPPYTEEFLRRGKVELQADTSTKRAAIYRYRESSFDKGEQVAVLGIVQEIMDETNTPVKVLREVRQEILTEDFFAIKGFNGWDRQSWLDLTEKPSVILTDMPRYFQGLEIPSIPPFLANAKYVDVSQVKSDEMKR